MCSRARDLQQEKSPQGEVHASQLEGSLHLPQLEKSLCSNKDPAQPKNESINLHPKKGKWRLQIIHLRATLNSLSYKNNDKNLAGKKYYKWIIKAFWNYLFVMEELEGHKRQKTDRKDRKDYSQEVQHYCLWTLNTLRVKM